MKKPRTRVLLGVAIIGAVLFALLYRQPAAQPSEWPGVDDAVIGRFVREAGRPPPQPIIEWMQGDLLLFAFLSAGLVSGFVLGFFARALFVEGQKPVASRSDRSA